MGSYRRPRRESIADHLAVARRRWHPQLPPWPEDAISTFFVEDLIKEHIINGPYSVQKAEGRGRGRRFHPRDYRDLLEVIRVKLSGIKHRSGWILHLWLRGHEYPIEDVRRYLLDELQASMEIVKKDFAPTGRFTEPFSEKYNRRVREAEGRFDAMSDIVEMIAPRMIRPQAIEQINPNIDRMADEFAGFFGVEAGTLKPIISEFVEAAKGRPTFSASSAELMMGLLQSGPVAQLMPLLMNAPPQLVQEFESSLTGCIDDGAGHSTLVEAVRQAPDKKLLHARRFWRASRSGQITIELNRGRSQCQPEHMPIIDALTPVMLSQRHINRCHPSMTAYTFSLCVAQL